MSHTSLAILAALLTNGCGDTSPPAERCEKPDLIFALSDASSSGFARWSVGHAPISTFGIELGRDAVLAKSRGSFFLLARLEDRIFPMNATCGNLDAPFATKPATGLGNPQDLSLAKDGTRWVTLFDTPTVLGIDGTGNSVGAIDLASLDDDGNPNASGVLVVGDIGTETLLVALERLDNRASKPEDYLQSTRPSALARLDPRTRSILSVSDLAGRNPFGAFVSSDGSLFLPTIGSVRFIDEADAGIVRIDEATLTSTLVLDERALGGSATTLAFGDSCGAAVVLGPSPNNATTVVTFDKRTFEMRTTVADSPLTSDNFYFTALAFRGDKLFVGDKRKVDAGYAIQSLSIAADCTVKLDEPLLYFPLPAVGIESVP